MEIQSKTTMFNETSDMQNALSANTKRRLMTAKQTSFRQLPIKQATLGMEERDSLFKDVKNLNVATVGQIVESVIKPNSQSPMERDKAPKRVSPTRPTFGKEVRFNISAERDNNNLSELHDKAPTQFERTSQGVVGAKFGCSKIRLKD